MNSGRRPSGPLKEMSRRRLGLGGAGNDRPLRAQVIVTVSVVLAMLAIPLYLLRRPSPAPPSGDGERASGAMDHGGLLRSKVDAGLSGKSRGKIGPVQRVKCSGSKKSRGNEGGRCDALASLEEGLAKAIAATTECAPNTGKAGTLNYVLELDFSRQRYKVFPGRSGDWKGTQAKRAAACVARSVGPIRWSSTPHQYRYYLIARMASYPAPELGDGFPVFE